MCGAVNIDDCMLMNFSYFFSKWCKITWQLQKCFTQSWPRCSLKTKTCWSSKITMRKKRKWTNLSTGSFTFPSHLVYCKAVWEAKSDQEQLQEKQKTANKGSDRKFGKTTRRKKNHIKSESSEKEWRERFQSICNIKGQVPYKRSVV
jgi:hypothetical protein